jgi:ABC-type glycerol-3-phosphate transport system permease component
MHKILGKLSAHVVLGTWCLFSVFFIAWILLASLKKTRDLFSAPWELPAQAVWTNYTKAWVNSHFDVYLLNSLVVVSLSVFFILLVSVPAAYVLARAKFRGREALTNVLVFGMGVPFPLLFVPLVVIITAIGLGDTLTGLTLVYVALSLPFTIYVLIGFFSSLPQEIESAAIVDGCSDFQVFRLVMFPMAMPGVATAAILNFVGLWNEYQLSLVLINSPENRTLSLGIYALISSMQYSGGDWPGLFAGIAIVMVPTLFAFAFASEKMISGMTMGGVK